LLVACNGARDPGPTQREPPHPVPIAQPAIAPVPAAEIPIVLQTEESDCGPAALTMTLNYYGRGTSLDAIKAAMQFRGKESSALDIVHVAQAHGVGVAGIAAEADAVLRVLQRGDILYVDFDHFVVVDRVLPDAIQILDPGMGRVTLHHASFVKRYSKVALLFAPTPEALAVREQAIGIR
jgi:ABC-type bacteriocin/lantibiotic exporter with double-glycine peptidase domain